MFVQEDRYWHLKCLSFDHTHMDTKMFKEFINKGKVTTDAKAALAMLTGTSPSYNHMAIIYGRTRIALDDLYADVYQLVVEYNKSRQLNDQFIIFEPTIIYQAVYQCSPVFYVEVDSEQASLHKKCLYFGHLPVYNVLTEPNHEFPYHEKILATLGVLGNMITDPNT